MYARSRRAGARAPGLKSTSPETTDREAPDGTVVLADGFSCRDQIRQLTGRHARHFAEVVCDAVHAIDVRRPPMEGAA